MRGAPTVKTALLLLSCRLPDPSSAFVLPLSSSSSSSPASSVRASLSPHRAGAASAITAAASATNGDDGDGATTSTEVSKAPTLNGKAVLPMRAMTAGLRGHKVAAVYAVLNSNYKRGSGEGWEHVIHVDITRDLGPDLSDLLSEKGSDAVAHVRALSFAYPQKGAMMDFADGWRRRVAESGGKLGWPAEEAEVVNENVITVGEEYTFDDEDDDDDEDMDHEEYMQMMAQSRAAVSPPPPAPLFVDNTGLTGITSLAPPKDDSAKEEEEEIVSPFEKATDNAIAHLSDEHLELNIENVDKVLDEVRPYLISDGGNVSVQKVDEDDGNVYLVLEGACGSCASSTVTMQMGIERVLKEKFGDALGEVLQVDPDAPDGETAPKELTVEAVQAEVNRMSQAIVAMGGVVRVVNVDPIGEVEIEYRGPNRVKKGLELALLDVEYVKHVKFVS